MKTKLKPCPFCGSEDVYLRVEGVVICNDCDARGSDSTNFFDPVCPMDLWNKRPGDDRMNILVNAMQKEIKKSGGNLRLEEALQEVGLGV